MEEVLSSIEETALCLLDEESEAFLNADYHVYTAATSRKSG